MVNVKNLFLDEQFEKRLVMTFEDFEFNFDDHFESLLFRNGLPYNYLIMLYIW